VWLASLASLASPACFAEAPTIQTDTGDGGMCPDDLLPPGLPECPPACTGGCDENVCTMVCQGEAVCQDVVLTCPAEYECEILCSGVDACDGVRIDCPADLPCALICEGGMDACGDSTVNCNAGECSVQCSALDGVCSGARMKCGSGACLGDCSGNSFPVLENCDESCGCTPCEMM
jgi:hypothetical protein